MIYLWCSDLILIIWSEFLQEKRIRFAGRDLNIKLCWKLGFDKFINLRKVFGVFTTKSERFVGTVGTSISVSKHKINLEALEKEIPNSKAYVCDAGDSEQVQKRPKLI